MFVFLDPSGLRWTAGIALEAVDGRTWPSTVWHLTEEQRSPIQDLHGSGEELRQVFQAPGWEAIRRLRRYRGATAVRLLLRRRAASPIALRRAAVLTGPVEAPLPSSRWRFYQNGFHSWSFAGTVPAGGRDAGTLFGPLGAPMTFDVATPPGPPGVRRSDLVAALIAGERALIVGQITTADQFVKIELNTRGAPQLHVCAELDGISVAPEEEIASEWIWVETREIPDPDPFGGYAEAVARAMQPRTRPHVPSGWCSWYFYYTHVRDADVRLNLQALAAGQDALPVELIQIDDGFQAAVGEWTQFSPRFPEGVAPLAREIREAGFTPGLWLAPFMAWPETSIVRAHPDWLLRDARGRPVSAGFNWYHWLRALDPTHPGVEAWLQELIHTVVHRWGFPYLKLDFLYAAALPGRRYDPKATRAHALRRGLQAIREAAGDSAFLLGCGCPLGPAIGLVDGMRIGPDVAPHWGPRMFGLSRPLRAERSLPAARNAVRNTLTRSWMHRRWWWNDPDCLLLRAHATSLTEDEIRLMLTAVALSGGMILISDPVTELPEDRRALWAALLPPTGDRPEIWDLFQQEFPRVIRRAGALCGAPAMWVGLLNPEDRPWRTALRLSDLGLPEEIWGFERWSGLAQRLTGSLPVDLPPHGAALWVLRPIQPGPQWVGSTLRILPGVEVVEGEEGASRGRWVLRREARAQGAVWLGIPGKGGALEIWWDGRPCSTERAGEGLWRVELAFQGTGVLEACRASP
jgi:alpha-galactosidase